MPTVGELLQAEREKQNLTVKDIEKATSIRAIYIQAIEDGKYDVLPGEVYLKGFIRNYASFLGLNPQQALDVYRESQALQTPQAPQPATPSAPASSAMLLPKVEAGREEERSSSLGRWVIVLVVLAVIAGAAWAVFNQLSQPPAPQPKPPQAQVQPAPAPAPTPAPQKSPAPVPAARPIVVVAKYTADCWTRVTADGREIYEGIPRVGETYTWNADQTMTIHLGNAAGVDLTYNGQFQGRLGGDGDVISKTYTANTTGTQR